MAARHGIADRPDMVAQMSTALKQLTDVAVAP
jgi:hypothetical protein